MPFNFDPNSVDFQKSGGLVPAIIQDHLSNKVLMQGYMNRAALDQTLSEGKVTFAYRDYKENRSKKTMHLDANHFLQRFLWHVLPEKFHRIRHYGFLANGIAEKSVAKIINQIGAKKSVKSAEKTQTGCICKNCGAGIMVVLKMITATGHLITLQNIPLFNSS